MGRNKGYGFVWLVAGLGLGAAKRITDWVEDTINYILNYRYNQKKTTILTSNLSDTRGEEAELQAGVGKFHSVDTLTDRIGVRVRSRLYEMCEVVKIEANDFRQTVLDHSH